MKAQTSWVTHMDCTTTKVTNLFMQNLELGLRIQSSKPFSPHNTAVPRLVLSP